MKEEWLMSGAVVPVDVETTAALVAEIHRLIGVVGNMALAQASQEPVGRFAKFTDGVWRPVTDYSAGVPLYTHPPQRTEQEPQIAFNAEVVGYVAPQRTWVDLTDEEVELYWDWEDFQIGAGRSTILEMVRDIEAKLKEKNL